MNKSEKILIIDFGGQYKQLIARRVRELNVYSEIIPYTLSMEEIRAKQPSGIIFTGGPNSVYLEDSPLIDKEIFSLGVPVLGICYGAQLITHLLGGKVEKAEKGEYGKSHINIKKPSALLEGVEDGSVMWMSHMDYISSVPEDFIVTTSTEHSPNASIEDSSRNIYAVQFHPEVNHSTYGMKLIENFVRKICKLQGLWRMDTFIEEKIAEIRELTKGKKVMLALSGGVDSSVVAALVSKAIGSNLICVFVDHGLLRQGEADQVTKIFTENFDISFVRIDASDKFLSKLAGIRDPEHKRKIIGEEFIRVFEEEAEILGYPEFLAQGTIYPDVIESGVGKSALIKSHHNVGGLPDNIDFKGIIEPLRDLFKDEVRQVGLQLGLPRELVYRQPFPGPGLAVRVIGEITREKLDILRPADAIFREEIKKAGLNETIGQYFAVLTDLKSVGVKGDERSYDYILALRAVDTTDFMTAEYSKIPHEVLDRTSRRILSETKGIGRIVYDITGKPPGTIEWE